LHSCTCALCAVLTCLSPAAPGTVGVPSHVQAAHCSTRLCVQGQHGSNSTPAVHPATGLDAVLAHLQAARGASPQQSPALSPESSYVSNNVGMQKSATLSTLSLTSFPSGIPHGHARPHFFIGRPVTAAAQGDSADHREGHWSAEASALRLFAPAPGTFAATVSAHVPDTSPYDMPSNEQLDTVLVHVLYSAWTLLMRNRCTEMGLSCDYHWAVFPQSSAVALAAESSGRRASFNTGRLHIRSTC
jgi:hypothetical protein